MAAVIIYYCYGFFKGECNFSETKESTVKKQIFNNVYKILYVWKLYEIIIRSYKDLVNFINFMHLKYYDLYLLELLSTDDILKAFTGLLIESSKKKKKTWIRRY